MLDENSFIRSSAIHHYNIYSEIELIQKENKLNYDINNTQFKIDILKKISNIDLGKAVILVIIGSILTGNIVTLLGLGVLTGIVIVKSTGYIGYKFFEKSLEKKVLDRKIIEKAIKQYEIDKEKKQKQLEDDKSYKKIKKNIFERIENLNKDELLTIKTIIDEYTTNKDIPSQVANIAQFLTETQVTDIDIKDTSLYNEVRGKARNYNIDHSRQN